MEEADKKRALLGFTVIAIMLALLLGTAPRHTTSFPPVTTQLTMTLPASSQLSTERRATRELGSPIWSTGFESGNHNDFNGGGNTEPPICAGNNPGEISTFAHSGDYSGYYYVNDPNAGEGCRDYYDLDLMDSHPTTRDIYVEMWAYVPSVTITGWFSFVSIKFQDWKGITIDTIGDRALYISDEIFTDDRGYQTGNMVQWPFDKWFKIGVEVHYKPASEVSTIILYQDDIMLVTLRTHALDARPLPLWNFHFGLYMGEGQKTFAVYNDDIAVYDLTDIVTTT